MPVTVETREEGHARYYVFSDPWKTSDLTSLYPQDKDYRDTVKFKVHTLMNVSQAKQIPPGLLAARKDAPAFEHPRRGEFVMVGAGAFPRAMAEMIFRLAHYDHAKFFETEDEGWAYIRQIIVRETVTV